MILASILLLAGCDSGDQPSVNVASMSISTSVPLIPRGGTRTLNLEVVDTDGSMVAWMDEGLDVKWSSSDPSVLTIDGNGSATGVAGGSALVTARLGTLSAEQAVDVIDLAGNWTATVPDPQAPGGVNVITYEFEQAGLSVSGTYSNLSGFPPLTPASRGRFSGTLNLRRIGSSVTIRVQVPGPPCDIAWSNELRLDFEGNGPDQLTPLAGTVPLSSSACSNPGQIRVAQVSRSTS